MSNALSASQIKMFRFDRPSSLSRLISLSLPSTFSANTQSSSGDAASRVVIISRSSVMGFTPSILPSSGRLFSVISFIDLILYNKINYIIT